MEVGDFHKHRHLASVFAFVGVLLYAALVPGHVVSQAAALAPAEEHGEAMLDMPCHDDMAAKHEPAPKKPSTPQKKCPFCTGYAAFMTALAGVCDASVIDAQRAIPRLMEVAYVHADGATSHPNNRGPPRDSLMS